MPNVCFSESTDASLKEKLGLLKILEMWFGLEGKPKAHLILRPQQKQGHILLD